jgi:pSer/pThr/pTyr-binding forkhead associated (FHA) protein
LIVVAGPDKDKVLPLDDSGRALIIGRGRESDFLLDITDASRRHTQVLRKADICYVRDLGSKIGTYTADGPVPMEKDCQLRHGDSFAIGPDLFVFEHAASEALKELERADDAAFEAPPEPVSQPAPECAPEAKEQEPQPAPTPTLSAPQPQRPRAKKPEPQGGWTAADVGIFILAIAILGFSALGLFWLFRSN